MLEKIKNGLKGVKRFMDKKAQMCKDILSSDKNKLAIGLVLIGAGIGLVASVYIPLPA